MGLLSPTPESGKGECHAVKGKSTLLRIRGLRKRWIFSSVGPILLILVLVSVILALSLASGYYISARTTLKTKASVGADYFNTYLMDTYSDYYYSATRYAASFDSAERIELQFLDSFGHIETSTRALNAGTAPGTPEIRRALETGKTEIYEGRDPATGEKILAVSCPLNFAGTTVGVMRYVTATHLIDRQIVITTLIIAAITYGTPLLFGTLGEILTEKSGNLNLGVEGIMFMGGALGLGGVYYYEKLSSSPNGFVAILVGIFFAFLAGAIASLIFSFLTITLRANQNVTGLALSIFGTGIGQFIGEYMRVSENGYISVSNMLKGYFQNSPFPKGLQDIPVVGGILFGNSFFFYLAVACAVALYWYLNKTRSGLYLRSVGEGPATADAAGINVTRYKYLATVIGGGVSAVGGMVYIMTIAGGVWNHEGLSGVGWLAVALVIFCLWRPLGAIWGSVLFGALMILYLRLVIAFIPTQLYKILPYVVTVIVLIISSMRNNKEKQPPASLGLNYFREER